MKIISIATMCFIALVSGTYAQGFNLVRDKSSVTRFEDKDGKSKGKSIVFSGENGHTLSVRTNSQGKIVAYAIDATTYAHEEKLTSKYFISKADNAFESVPRADYLNTYWDSNSKNPAQNAFNEGEESNSKLFEMLAKEKDNVGTITMMLLSFDSVTNKSTTKPTTQGTDSNQSTAVNRDPSTAPATRELR